MEEPHEPTGLDLARVIARGLAGRTGAAHDQARGRYRRRRDPVNSSAHPDDRDPQTLDATLGRFVDEQGWKTELRVHGVFSRWEAIVGQEVAKHVTPESFADGRLVVRTDTTAWATEMTLPRAQLRTPPQRGPRRRDRQGHRRGRTARPVLVPGPAAGQGPGAPRHLRLSRGSGLPAGARQRAANGSGDVWGVSDPRNGQAGPVPGR